jgi:AcrR family transcriptional regulator
VEFGVATFVTDEGIAPAPLGLALEERDFGSVFVAEHTHITVKRESRWPEADGELPRKYLPGAGRARRGHPVVPPINPERTDCVHLSPRATVRNGFVSMGVVMRGRGEAREEAILLATLALLAEVGYDQMTMDAVAARARASKATIYRRWPGKAELVVTAVKRHAGSPTVTPPDTGSLRQDLLAVLEVMRAGLTGQDAALILGLMIAMRRDPELARTVRGQVVDDKREVFGAVIARAVDRGDLPATVDHALFVEISSAMLFSRLFVTGEPLDDAFIHHLVDAVLLPLLDHRSSRS